MRRHADLENRLVEWGRAYGGSKYEYVSAGISPLAVLMKWHGRPPSGLAGASTNNSAADEVHAAYTALKQQEQGCLPAEVLRYEYWFPGQPVDSKLQKLRKNGNNIGRVRYYQHLRVARIYIAGRLHLPFSDGAENIFAAALV